MTIFAFLGAGHRELEFRGMGEGPCTLNIGIYFLFQFFFGGSEYKNSSINVCQILRRYCVCMYVCIYACEVL